jgi:hypothetical protein
MICEPYEGESGEQATVANIIRWSLTTTLDAQDRALGEGNIRQVIQRIYGATSFTTAGVGPLRI